LVEHKKIKTFSLEEKTELTLFSFVSMERRLRLKPTHCRPTRSLPVFFFFLFCFVFSGSNSQANFTLTLRNKKKNILNKKDGGIRAGSGCFGGYILDAAERRPPPLTTISTSLFFYIYIYFFPLFLLREFFFFYPVMRLTSLDDTLNDKSQDDD
jgi:hypothetical protein